MHMGARPSQPATRPRARARHPATRYRTKMYCAARRVAGSPARWLSSAAASSSSAEAGGGGFSGWIAKRKHGLIHLAFSGIALSLSAQLTVQAHKLEDVEEEMHRRVRQLQRSRQELIRRAPALAVAAGLPAPRESEFEASLSALLAEHDALRTSAVPEGSHATVAATASESGGSAMGGGAAPRQMF